MAKPVLTAVSTAVRTEREKQQAKQCGGGGGVGVGGSGGQRFGSVTAILSSGWWFTPSVEVSRERKSQKQAAETKVNSCLGSEALQVKSRGPFIRVQRRR